MAANRKLVQLVDSTLRKVEEGLFEFEQMWSKVEECSNPNQREKYMTDLKKEIKKLQRYREDIMKWSSNPEVRDKVVLAESRRRIEVEMEKFKAFERESKTKPFSMMGLAMGGRMDAQEQKKHEKRESIEEIVEGLTRESDSIRVEWESLNAKKKKSKSDLTRIDDLKKYSEWHAFHMQSLEQVLRRLDNDLLDPDDLDVLIESLQLYLDQYEELDYYNDPDMYQQYDLDSDAVDETYYKPSLEESMDTIREPDFIPPSSSGDAPKLREVPLTAAAKARAKKQAAREIEAALSGDPIRPDYPHQHPPKPVRPPMPNIPPPTIPAPSHPPSHPAPIQADFLSSRDGSTLSQHSTGASVWGMDNRLKTQGLSLSVNQHIHGLPLMKMLEFSHSNRPRGLDSLHRHAYRPSNSYVQLGNDGRSIYPTKTTRQNDHSLFVQLPFDALQLIFHYREGTPSQFLAAQELKRRHWRLHKKFGIWMQRTGGEIKSSNPTFEYGSYDFFDVGNDNWSIRTKGDFTFDYEFLDDDMVPTGYIDDKLRTICRPII